MYKTISQVSVAFNNEQEGKVSELFKLSGYDTDDKIKPVLEWMLFNDATAIDAAKFFMICN
jgi:hypothetical protein